MKPVLRSASLVIATLLLTSCLGLIVDAVGPKPEYNGPKPPRAIPAENAASAQWLSRDPYELPPSSQMSSQQIKYDSNGVPYGIESPYRNCVHSPYSPFPRLDITGMKSQQIVYDPYARKSFRIP